MFNFSFKVEPYIPVVLNRSCLRQTERRVMRGHVYMVFELGL